MKKIYILGLIYLFSFSLCLAETPSGDVYYNKTLGFKIVKPPAWVFEAAIDNSPESDGTPVSEKELMKKLAKYKSKTLVQIQKYQQLYGDINPTVTVSAIKFDDDMFISKDPVKILGPFISLLKKKYTDNLNFTDGPKSVQISGIESSCVKFTVNESTSVIHSICGSFWVIPREKFMFLIFAGARQDEQIGLYAEIQNIIDSIEIRL